MGRKIICESCSTIFREEVLGDKTICPVCGKSLVEDLDIENVNPSDNKDFGEGVLLGQDDSFNEEEIDFWWYSIREPGTLDESDTGDVSTTCAKCGTHSFSPYPIAQNDKYILIDSRWKDICGKCGNQMKNHILSKRPADYVDPREHKRWMQDYENTPKCPICGSIKIHKISLTNKAVSAVTFGFLAAGHVSKTYKCDICSSKF